MFCKYMINIQHYLRKNNQLKILLVTMGIVQIRSGLNMRQHSVGQQKVTSNVGKESSFSSYMMKTQKWSRSCSFMLICLLLFFSVWRFSSWENVQSYLKDWIKNSYQTIIKPHWSMLLLNVQSLSNWDRISYSVFWRLTGDVFCRKLVHLRETLLQPEKCLFSRNNCVWCQT